MIDSKSIGFEPGGKWLARIATLVGVLLIALPVLALFGALDLGQSAKLWWFCYSFGLGTAGFGLLGHRGYWTYATLILLLFVGGAAQLWLTQPLWFPAYSSKPAGGLIAVMVAIVLLQAASTLYIIGKMRSLTAIRDSLRKFGTFRILAIVILLALFSVSPMGYIPYANFKSYVAQLVGGGAVIIINSLTLLALALLPQPMINFDNIPKWLLPIVAIVSSALLSWFAFQTIPHVEDEVAYLFQARILAEGHLWVASPPAAALAGLDYYLLSVFDGRWFSTQPIGWPAILAIGTLFSAPWLVNPLFAGAAIWLSHRVTERLTDSRHANIVALLMCCSPWVLGASASMMPHMSALVLTLFAWNLLLIPTDRSAARLFFPFISGLCIGWVFVTRQLDGLLLGVATGLWLLSHIHRINGWHRVISYSIGCIVSGSIALIFNAIMTGNPLLAPLEIYLNELWYEGANNYGFGSRIGPPGGWGGLDISIGHSPFEAVVNTIQNWVSLQRELFGWGTGSLVFFWCLIFWGKLNKTDWMMLGLSIAVILSMAFYWFTGSFYLGPRYWFAALFPFVFLSARGAQTLYFRFESASLNPKIVTNILITLCIFGITIFTPWRGVAKYYQYGNFQTEALAAITAGTFDNAVVVFRTKAQPGSYQYLNYPSLPNDRPIFIQETPDLDRDALARAFPGREIIDFSR